MDFDINRILRILPHRAPFVLIDRVVELAPRQSARAYKCVTYNEPFFPGHFPGQPIFPGGLILEAMAQLTGVLAYASEPFDNAQKVMYFLGVEEAKFRRPVVPGDRMVIDISVIQRRSNIWKIQGDATVDGHLCASAKLLAALTDKHDIPQGSGSTPV
ncbi:MAG: 3-hydroxyacyl-ACP dehydratase FabZ [Sandaracinaceae bacterium]|nr:3-hydroxyacyl-ACP dehydratase FabZ [Sandaracinaceae bacterium]